MTGSVRVQAGKDTVDIGLCVKNSKGPVCVPDYTRPAENGAGWQYSQALQGVLAQYKARTALYPAQHPVLAQPGRESIAHPPHSL